MIQGAFSRILQVPAAECMPLFQAGRDGLSQCLIELMEGGAEAFQHAFGDDDNQVAWMELRNKLEVFRMFEHGGREVGDLDCARSRGPFAAVWLAESIGYDCAGRALRRGELPLLRCSDLPCWCLVPFHAGWGLRMAEDCLTQLDAISRARHADGTFADELAGFINAAREIARPGFAGILQEALGLCARNLYPWLMTPIDAELQRLGAELRDLFWHGAGRAMYFAPMNFMPWRSPPWESLAAACSEPPDRRCRSNAIAGVTWAMCLVNIRCPEVMACILRHHGNALEDGSAFRQGIGSAMRIWARSAPDDGDSIHAFMHYGATLDAPVRRLWHEFITRPCATVFEDHATPDAVFRYSGEMT